MNYILSKELLADIDKLPRNKRQGVLKVIGEKEFEKCAADIFYWLDESKHPGVPYVYTQDPHPLHLCKKCKGSEFEMNTHHFNKRSIHLKLFHDIDEENFQMLAGYFTELDTTRTFTIMPYMPPIIEAWLSQQFVFWAKSRDMMATWLTVTMYTWDTLFHKGKQNIFQSEDASKTLELIERAFFLYKNQPPFLKNVHKATFGAGGSRSGVMKVDSLGSSLLGFPQGADQIRQYHPSGVFQDEAAFQPEASASFAAIKPAIQQGGRFTAVSSANPGWFQLCVTDHIAD